MLESQANPFPNPLTRRRRVVKTFWGWLSQQSERGDAVGVLSRSALKDKIFPRHASKLSVLLLRYDQGSELRAALKTAHGEWRKVRREASL